MRKHYLDNIRWSTVVLVVLYHVLYMYNAEGIPGVLGKITHLEVQYYDVFQYIVYPWFMAILFLVSGISSRYCLENCSDGEFLRKRTRKLLVPSTIGLLAFQFVQGYVNASLAGVYETGSGMPPLLLCLITVLSGVGVLWYIQLLWVFSLLLIPLRRLDRDRLWMLGRRTGLPLLLALAVPVWGAAQILNTPIIVVYRCGLYGFLFLLGYFVFSHQEVVETLKRWFFLFLVLALALGTAFCVTSFGLNYADAPVNRSPLFTGYCWFACLAVLGGMARYGDVAPPFTVWMRDRSFGLYVFHYLGISSVALFLGKPGRLPAPVIYLLSLLAGFFGGYLLNAVISRIPFLRWAVLGIGSGQDRKAKTTPTN